MGYQEEWILKTKYLKEMKDDAGRWLFEYGELHKPWQATTKAVGTYESTKRVVTGGPENKAALTITMFLVGIERGESVTLMGAHDFTTGNQIGGVSVSALTADNMEHWSEDGRFRYSSRRNVLTLSTE